MWGGEYCSADSDISTSQLDLHKKTGQILIIILEISDQFPKSQKIKRKLYSLHECSRQSCPYSIPGLSMALDDAVTPDSGAVSRVSTQWKRIEQSYVDLEKNMFYEPQSLGWV